MTISKDDLGGLQATVMVDANNKGLAVGRNGRNIERAKILAQRYFDRDFTYNDKHAAEGDDGAVVKDGKVSTWFVCRTRFTLKA